MVDSYNISPNKDIMSKEQKSTKPKAISCLKSKSLPNLKLNPQQNKTCCCAAGKNIKMFESSIKLKANYMAKTQLKSKSLLNHLLNPHLC